MRWGYQRIHMLLQQEGWGVNLKRVHSLYRLDGLQPRAKAPKPKVAAKQREARPVATAPNQVWAMDFMADQLFDGHRIRLLTIVDAYSRLCPAIDVRHIHRGIDVVETRERVTAVHGVREGAVDVPLKFQERRMVISKFGQPRKRRSN